MDSPAALPASSDSLISRQELRATLTLAWPLILANVTQQLIVATDVLLMSWLGPLALAASALALNFTYTLNMFLMGLLLASSPMMATALGARSNSVREVRRTFRAGLWLLIVAMPVYWLILWHIGAIMVAFGQSPSLAANGQRFLRAYMWCTAPWLLFTLLRNFVSALERPRAVFVLSGVGIVLNAVVSWSLIFGHFGLPALGIVGGGLGSTITWSLLCLAMVTHVLADRRFRRFHLFGRWWRFDGERTLAMVKLGLPIGITMGLEMGVFALAAYFMGWIGAPAVAAHAIALQIAAFTFMVPLGLGQAATVRVGLAVGRKDQRGIGQAGWTAWTLGVGFMAVMALGIWAIPHSLVTLFLADTPRNAAVIALAVSFLKVAAAFQLADGAQVIGAGMLRGLHDTKWPLIFALFGYWGVGLGIGSWLAFGADWKGVGIWIGLASGLAVVAALMVGRWLMRERLGLTPGGPRWCRPFVGNVCFGWKADTGSCAHPGLAPGPALPSVRAGSGGEEEDSRKGAKARRGKAAFVERPAAAPLPFSASPREPVFFAPLRLCVNLNGVTLGDARQGALRASTPNPSLPGRGVRKVMSAMGRKQTLAAGVAAVANRNFCPTTLPMGHTLPDERAPLSRSPPFGYATQPPHRAAVIAAFRPERDTSRAWALAKEKSFAAPLTPRRPATICPPSLALPA